jgi:hypothetical protein
LEEVTPAKLMIENLIFKENILLHIANYFKKQA